jgi:hypothetical protein
MEHPVRRGGNTQRRHAMRAGRVPMPSGTAYEVESARGLPDSRYKPDHGVSLI